MTHKKGQFRKSCPFFFCVCGGGARHSGLDPESYGVTYLSQKRKSSNHALGPPSGAKCFFAHFRE